MLKMCNEVNGCQKISTISFNVNVIKYVSCDGSCIYTSFGSIYSCFYCLINNINIWGCMILFYNLLTHKLHFNYIILYKMFFIQWIDVINDMVLVNRFMMKSTNWNMLYTIYFNWDSHLVSFKCIFCLIYINI